MASKSTLKIILWVVATPFLLAGLVFAYWTVTFIDVKVTAGAHYGFTIGDSKRAVFRMGAETFGTGNGRVTVKEPVAQEVRMGFTEADFQKLAEHDVWVFHYDDTLPVDRIALTFAGDRLVSIHRQRACCAWLPRLFLDIQKYFRYDESN